MFYTIFPNIPLTFCVKYEIMNPYDGGVFYVYTSRGNADPIEYRCATGLESLFGYLYAMEQHDRAAELFEQIWTAISKE